MSEEQEGYASLELKGFRGKKEKKSPQVCNGEAATCVNRLIKLIFENRELPEYMHHALNFDILALGQRGAFKITPNKSALNDDTPLDYFSQKN